MRHEAELEKSVLRMSLVCTHVAPRSEADLFLTLVLTSYSTREGKNLAISMRTNGLATEQLE